MKTIKSLLVKMGVVMTCALASCSKEGAKNTATPDPAKSTMADMIKENGTNPDEAILTHLNGSNPGLTTTSSGEANENSHRHFLYSESNESGNNRVLAYEMGASGTLYWKGATASGGAGTGMGLGSQGALALDEDHEWLYVVNAGSNSVSSFKVHKDGSLTLAHTENTRGTTPVSLSVHGDLLYVLNFGSDNIHGFWLGEGGTLTHIDGSTRALSGKGVVAPQISFTPDGDWVIVTEKATNKISSFKVRDNGSVWPAVITPSTGQTPFGFDFGRDGYMIVSNAAGGAADAGSATSYRIAGNGTQQAVNGAIPNYQSAPCWVATTKYGRFAFVTNTASNSISSYYIAPGGYLFLVDKAAAATDKGPIDIVVAKNNYNVYALNSKSGTITEYHRKFFGSLEPTGSVSGLPAPVTGLAIY